MKAVFDALKDNVDDVVVTTTEKKATQIKFSNNKILSTTDWDRRDIGIFVASKKRVAATTVEGTEDVDLKNAVKNLLGFIGKLKKRKYYHGIAEGPFTYKPLKGSFDVKVAGMGDGVDLVDSAINAASEHGAKRSDGVLEFGSYTKHTETSNGVSAQDKGTDLYLSLRAFVDKHASGHVSTFSRMLKDFDPTKAGAGAEIAGKAVYPERVVAGKYDVVFSPLAFANVLQHVGEAASIFSVESGLSFLTDKDKQVAAESVSISDNGALENGFHSTKFDEEGVPTQETPIIENGVLTSYLHNTSTAMQYKTESTGNAGLISPDPWNIVMQEGDQTKDELFSGVRKGIYVTNLWYTRFSDYAAGDFSTIPRDGAFFIDNGELKYPVNGIRISENILTILKNVSAIGRNSERVIGWEVETPVVTPMVVAKDINISTSTH